MVDVTICLILFLTLVIIIAVHPVSCPTHETLAPRRQLQLTNGEVNVCDTPDGPPCDKNAKLSAFCTTPG